MLEHFPTRLELLYHTRRPPPAVVVLLFAQLSGVDGLRGQAAVWNANAHHHYRLSSTALKRSTLSDANARRPAAIFAETFEQLSALAD